MGDFELKKTRGKGADRKSKDLDMATDANSTASVVELDLFSSTSVAPREEFLEAGEVADSPVSLTGSVGKEISGSADWSSFPTSKSTRKRTEGTKGERPSAFSDEAFTLFELESERKSGKSTADVRDNYLGGLRVIEGGQAHLFSENRLIIGVDEVGRGSLAGPVVACACYFDSRFIGEEFKEIVCMLRDSKRLSKKKRESIASLLRQSKTVKFGVGQASPTEIDAVNILNATILAMVRAYQFLPTIKEDCKVLVDGDFAPDFSEVDESPISTGIGVDSDSVIKGDDKVLEIMAASILAKVYRDQIMLELSKINPGYGWEANVGYGTKGHMDALNKLGPNKHHRRTFLSGVE